MAKVYPSKPNPDNDLTLEEIEDAIHTVGFKTKGWPETRIYMTFTFAGTYRECQVKNRQTYYVTPSGRKADRMAKVVLDHVLKFPQGNIPSHIMLQVLLGNE